MLKRELLLLSSILTLCGVLFFVCDRGSDGRQIQSSRFSKEDVSKRSIGLPSGDSVPDVQRIVSLAPSITETIFSLGCGQNLVGVTNFCDYPPQARSLCKVGGYIDPNLEAILSLKPDIVIMLKSHVKVIDFCNRFSLRYLAIENNSLQQILESFTMIGRVCHRDSAAALIRGLVVSQIDSVIASQSKAGTARQTEPAVLFCVGRNDVGSGHVTNAWFAGSNTVYDDFLTAAGGRNCLVNTVSQYPQLGTESILRLKPDIIIDCIDTTQVTDRRRVIADWSASVSATTSRPTKVYCLSRDYVSIPGPRIWRVLADLRQIVKENSASSNSTANCAVTDTGSVDADHNASVCHR